MAEPVPVSRTALLAAIDEYASAYGEADDPDREQGPTQQSGDE